MGANAGRTYSIPNGCDPAIFRPGAEGPTRSRLGIPEGDRVILFVGRLDPAKGLDELLQAFGKLAVEERRLHLVLAGEGRYDTRMQAFVRENQLSDRVWFAGPLQAEDVAAWMAAADVFCLPSYSEGCPNVVLEALSCGCPVVASDVGGIPEIVPTDCGILVSPHHPEELTEALRKALAASWNREYIATRRSRSGTRWPGRLTRCARTCWWGEAAGPFPPAAGTRP